MKKSTLFFIATLLLGSCSQNGEKSDAYGNFETEPVIISGEVQGKILTFLLEKGQKTKPGQIAVIIDTTQFMLKINELGARKNAVLAGISSVDAELSVLNEQKKNLEINKKRTEAMVSDGAATKKQLDDLTSQISVIEKQAEATKTRYTAIHSELEIIAAQKQILLDQLSRCTVRCPVTGSILETYAEAGELATPGKALFKTADLSELTLRVYVSGAQLGEITTGQEVEVLADKSATENRSYSGTVTWISDEAEFTPKIIQTKEERVKLVYAVKIAVKNDGSLKPGMPGEVRWKSLSR